MHWLQARPTYHPGKPSALAFGYCYLVGKQSISPAGEFLDRWRKDAKKGYRFSSDYSINR